MSSDPYFDGIMRRREMNEPKVDHEAARTYAESWLPDRSEWAKSSELCNLARAYLELERDLRHALNCDWKVGYGDPYKDAQECSECSAISQRLGGV